MESCTSEETWLAALSHAERFEPSGKPLVVVSPHPDDESLAAGGFIAAERARGVEVTVVAVTDGEAAYADAPHLAAMRVGEQAEAVAALGVEPQRLVRLHLPDSGLSERVEQIAELLGPLVTPDAHLIAPWLYDRHPDHEACGEAAKRVAERTGAQLSWWFFWTWHWSTPADLAGLPLARWELSAAARESKRRAIGCHRSQLAWPGGEPILPKHLLAPAYRSFEVFAHQG